MAFDKLCRENKKDSARRLAGCMLKHSYISLGIGDIDWEIDMAIRQCGGEPRTGYRYTARFHFNLKTEMEKEKYDRAVKELYGKGDLHGGGRKVASVIYNGMYGKQNPAVHR